MKDNGHGADINWKDKASKLEITPSLRMEMQQGQYIPI